MHEGKMGPSPIDTKESPPLTVFSASKRWIMLPCGSLFPFFLLSPLPGLLGMHWIPVAASKAKWRLP